MPDLLTAAIAFALSQLLLSALLLLGSSHWSIQRRLYALLLLAILAYLLVPLTVGYSWGRWINAVATAVPGLFWLFSASLFDDEFRLRRWQVSLVAVTVMLPVVGELLEMIAVSASELVFYAFPQVVEFVLLGLTFVVVARHWRVDLIESRRRLRLWFCGLNCVYIFVLILFREVVFPDADWLRSLQYLPLGLMLMATNALLLEYKPGLLGGNNEVALSADEPHAGVVASNDVIEVDQQLVSRLQTMVEENVVYRQMGLTIGQLAARLDIPEYKLRQTINAGLGYRNFNDYLNSFRVKEAAEQLASPDHAELSILTIALEVGFRSLSSFNKAFKSTYQKTPTEFRRLGLRS